MKKISLEGLRLKAKYAHIFFLDSNMDQKEKVLKTALINQDEEDCNKRIEIAIKDEINKYEENTMEDIVDEIRTDVNVLGKTDPINMMLDTISLITSVKDDYAKANEIDKEKFLKFFFYGMAFMFGSMIMSLWSLGFNDALFYVKFIGTTIMGFGFAWIATKVKEVIPVKFSNNKGNLMNLLNKIVKKLT